MFSSKLLFQDPYTDKYAYPEGYKTEEEEEATVIYSGSEEAQGDSSGSWSSESSSSSRDGHQRPQGRVRKKLLTRA